MPSPGMISSWMPALAKVDWMERAMVVVGSLFRVSMVSLNPFSSPASFNRALALSTSREKGVSSRAPRKPLGKKA